MSFPLRRLELENPQFVGAGYDLVDVRVLPPEGEPVVVTFMLDSGLTLNLVTPELATKLNLPLSDGTIDAAALGGEAKRLSMTAMPGLELVNYDPNNATFYMGVWEGDDGWRALASLDWDDWVSQAKRSKGVVTSGALNYTCLPAPNGTNYVGLRGTEFVKGDLDEEGKSFVGGGVAVEPKGFLACVDRYEFSKEGEELLEAYSGMRLRPTRALSSVGLGPVLATAVPFSQAAMASTQGVELSGMLGQYPLHREFVLDVDPGAGKLSVYPPSAAAAVAGAAGLERLQGQELDSSLMAVQLLHAPLAPGRVTGRAARSVPAMVDSGAANSFLNWPAAELLLGLRKDDKIVQNAPLMRATGVGGGQVDMPLITLSLGLGLGEAGGPVVRTRPVRVAIGDAEVFESIAGREEQGSWPFGLGPRELKPAAILGQDVLSQQRYLFAVNEPALYMQQQVFSYQGSLDFVGKGDCLDEGGRRLQGAQRLGCSPDFAAETCLSLPSGTCQGIAVTPLDTHGPFSGLCYIFVSSQAAMSALEEDGFRPYTTGPDNQELAAAGASVVSSTGQDGADCFRWLPR